MAELISLPTQESLKQKAINRIYSLVAVALAGLYVLSAMFAFTEKNWIRYRRSRDHSSRRWCWGRASGTYCAFRACRMGAGQSRWRTLRSATGGWRHV